jgi:adenylate cyclase
VCTFLAVNLNRLQGQGAYDPLDPDAPTRLELLEYLATELGASDAELVTFKDSLPELAGLLTIRGPASLTLEEVAEQAGVGIQTIRNLALAAGIPDPEPEVPMFNEGFVAFASAMTEVGAIFGDEACIQISRVLGSAMARIADAVLSSFLVNVAPAARDRDPAGLGLARANVAAASLLDVVAPALDGLLRQQLLIAQRSASDEARVDGAGFETRQLIVGFVDLVGSTEMGEKLDMVEFSAMLADFERICLETITEGGGRLVKLIGDEIMYTAPDAFAASSIALDLADAFQDHDTIPQIRAGLAGGPVMLRDGDIFGPTVNLASRVVNTAKPGEVLTTTDVAEGAELPEVPLGSFELSGIPGQTTLHRLIRL